MAVTAKAKEVGHGEVVGVMIGIFGGGSFRAVGYANDEAANTSVIAMGDTLGDIVILKLAIDDLAGVLQGGE